MIVICIYKDPHVEMMMSLLHCQLRGREFKSLPGHRAEIWMEISTPILVFSCNVGGVVRALSGRGGAFVDSMHFDRRVTGSNPALPLHRLATSISVRVLA